MVKKIAIVDAEAMKRKASVEALQKGEEQATAHLKSLKLGSPATSIMVLDTLKVFRACSLHTPPCPFPTRVFTE